MAVFSRVSVMLGVVFALTGGAVQAATIAFDLRNTAEGQDLEDTGSATKGGVTMTATSNGAINALAATLGINFTGSSDDSGLFDDSNGDNTGTEELLDFVFDVDLTLDSIDFTNFSGTDQATLTIGGGSPITITSGDSTNPYAVNAFLLAGTHVVLQYDNNTGNNGWGIETVTVTPVPAPTGLAAGLGLMGLMMIKRRGAA